MPRIARSAILGFAYHIFNRGNDKRLLFPQPADYQFFLRLLSDAPTAGEARLLAYCLMPNHWHLVVMPSNLPALSAYMHWVTTLHGRRWRREYGREASGHVYASRYKSVPIRTDEHLLIVLRYVEANPVRAGLVTSARDWPWSSRSRCPCVNAPVPGKWPWPVPNNWDEQLDRRQPDEQVRAARAAPARSAPIVPDAPKAGTDAGGSPDPPLF